MPQLYRLQKTMTTFLARNSESLHWIMFFFFLQAIMGGFFVNQGYWQIDSLSSDKLFEHRLYGSDTFHCASLHQTARGSRYTGPNYHYHFAEQRRLVGLQTTWSHSRCCAVSVASLLQELRQFF